MSRETEFGPLTGRLSDDACRGELIKVVEIPIPSVQDIVTGAEAILCEAVALIVASKVLLTVVGLEDAERCFGTVSQFLPCHRQPEAPKSVRWAVLTAGSRLPGTYDFSSSDSSNKSSPRSASILPRSRISASV